MVVKRAIWWSLGDFNRTFSEDLEGDDKEIRELLDEGTYAAREEPRS